MIYDDYFDVDSEFFIEYMKIIQENYNRPRTRCEGRQLHHIIPRSFFKKIGKDVDNSKDNLISLSQAEHWLCHWLIYQCAKKGFRSLAFCAIKNMTNPILKGIYTIEDARTISKYAGYARNEISEKARITKAKKKRKRGVDDMMKDIWKDLPL